MMDDELRAWLGGDDPSDDGEGWQDARGRRRRFLWLLAAVPWLVVGGLALTGQARPAEPVPLPAPLVAAAAPLVAAAETAAPVAAPSAAPSALDPEVAAAAVLAVHERMTGAAAAAGQMRSVDLAVAEAAQTLGGVTIVRVTALVREGTEGRWQAPRVARYAVPIVPGPPGAPGPRPAAAPWPLPEPPPPDPAGGFIAVDDLALATAAAGALEAAGYTGVEVAALARDPALPGVLRAEVSATAPGESAARAHTVWLRDDPDPALLGWDPPPALLPPSPPVASAAPRRTPARRAPPPPPPPPPPREPAEVPPATITTLPATVTGSAP